MRNICFFIFVVAVLMYPVIVAGTGFDRFDIEASILDDSATQYRIEMKFDEPLIKLNHPFNFKLKNLTISNDFGDAKCNILLRGKVDDLSCEFSGMSADRRTLTLNFYTAGDTTPTDEKRRYSSNFFIRLPINKTSFLVRLPDRGALSEQPTNNSYYPQNGLVKTDGRYIMVYWQQEGIKSGDTLTYSVSYTVTGGEFSVFYNTIILLVIILAIVGGGIIWFIFKHRTLTKKSSEVLISVLDKDEKTVYDILIAHGGSIGQKVVVRESNFSKAKVSRVVRRLKSRNIVDIIPISGRENKIALKDQQKKTEEQKPQQNPETSEQNTNQPQV